VSAKVIDQRIDHKLDQAIRYEHNHSYVGLPVADLPQDSDQRVVTHVTHMHSSAERWR